MDTGHLSVAIPSTAGFLPPVNHQPDQYTIGDIFRKRVEHKGKASQNEQVQMQADINALKKSVDEMKEYLTDLYIQQHDQKLSKKIDEP